MAQGLLLVISGPSGVGKGTICKALRERNHEIVYSISATTRLPRPGEVDGVSYYFLSPQEFLEALEKGDFLEWAQVYGNYYGTPAWFVEEQLAEGRNVILEIDMQGAMKVKQTYPHGVFIFVLPPSQEELARRLIGRCTDAKDVIAKRLAAWKEEMKTIDNYDYAVVNDEVELAVKKIEAIIEAERCRVARRNRD